jgi:hypothetical protein
MKKLIIYDVDDTLFAANQLIGMEVHGEFRWLTQQEFHHHDVAGTVSETIDLSRLRNAKDWLLNLQPNEEVVERIKCDINSGDSDIVIMTARNAMDDHELFKSGFDKHGIDTTCVDFYFAGDHGEQHWSSHKKKGVLFQQFLSQHYDHITIFDDNEMNLKELHFLALDYPFVTVESYKVAPGGTISRYIGS